MTRWPGPALLALILAGGAARAEGDLANFRPKPRPVLTEISSGAPTLRPMPRPQRVAAGQPDRQPGLRPRPRPDFTLQSVAQNPANGSMKGAVCKRPEIKGKALPPITARKTGCKVADPVLVSEIAGVKLVPPATINCEGARALSTWISTGLQPAFDNTVVRLNIADSYSCRTRNNVPGAKVSVHGLGQAIDIAGFRTADGRTYTVADNYGSQIKAAHKAACGIFSTTLGPGSDGYHEDHLHLDVSDHGGRDYCR